ncbi:uncharacterized protein BDCG_16065, partial [Blastomyces dermatitidis ER-3]
AGGDEPIVDSKPNKDLSSLQQNISSSGFEFLGYTYLSIKTKYRCSDHPATAKIRSWDLGKRFPLRKCIYLCFSFFRFRLPIYFIPLSVYFLRPTFSSLLLV